MLYLTKEEFLALPDGCFLSVIPDLLPIADMFRVDRKYGSRYVDESSLPVVGIQGEVTFKGLYMEFVPNAISLLYQDVDEVKPYQQVNCECGSGCNVKGPAHSVWCGLHHV